MLDRIYRHNCPNEELGYYSGTPNGNVDILPIEAEDFSNYRLLIAPGYNKAEDEDLEKLKDFVTEGGTLLIGWPQLSITVDRKKAISYEHTYWDQKERILQRIRIAIIPSAFVRTRNLTAYFFIPIRIDLL